MGRGRLFMQLLFIKLKHIGDALLMTPMLTAVRARYPEAGIHVVVRRGTEDILNGCRAIDQIHVAAAISSERNSSAFWQDLKLMMRLRRVGFNYAFELGDGDRGRLLAVLSGARQKCANDTLPAMKGWWRACFTHVANENWKWKHRVEKDYGIARQYLDLPDEIPPLCFETNAIEPFPHPLPTEKPYLIFHPATRWMRKRWPVQNWVRLGQALGEKYRIIVSSGPDRAEIAESTSIASDIGPAASTTGGKLSWAQLAKLIRGAKLFVGVDTAAMHLAAACQRPVVAIFGASRDWAWHPWKTPYEVVSPSPEFWPTGEPADVAETLRTIIKKVEVQKVLSACQSMLASIPESGDPLTCNAAPVSEIPTSAQ